MDNYFRGIAFAVLLLLRGVLCSGIAKLNLQKIMPIKSGMYNRLAFSSNGFWSSDSSHTMTQDGEIVIQMVRWLNILFRNKLNVQIS